MAYSCLVYIARTQPNIPRSAMIEMKDHDTRRYAKAQASGVRIFAGELVFEIIEAPGNIAEQLLDEISESEHIEDPEIILFAPLKSRSFKAWMFINCDASADQDHRVESLRLLAQQAQENPGKIPQTLTKMLSLFQNTDHNAQAA